MGTESRFSPGRTELPSDFAEHAAALTGLDTPPRTFEALWTTVAEQYAAEDVAVGLADLYSDEPTRHEVHVNGRVRYAQCALDALEAAVMENQETVTVRSVDPVSGTPVWVTVGDADVDVSPEGAIVCFGSSVDVGAIEEAGSLAAWSVRDEREVQASVCQHTNAFESEATYERWAAETESVTAPLPPENVVPLLRDLPQESD